MFGKTVRINQNSYSSDGVSKLCQGIFYFRQIRKLQCFTDFQYTVIAKEVEDLI